MPEPTQGNLASYRDYIRPAAHSMYGSFAKPALKHHQNVHKLLKILLVHGTCTTWEMAKTEFRKDTPAIREREKTYRRILVGRTDSDKYTGGMLEIGLVVYDGRSPRKKNYNRYRLSLYGILYCLEVLEPSRTDIDKMTVKYSHLLPRIFGRWTRLKSTLGKDAYNLRILAQGMLLDKSLPQTENPIYDLMSFLRIKYRKNFESIPEQDLAEQISYWFYTFLLYRGDAKLKKVLEDDANLRRWYKGFVRDAKRHYSERFHRINRVNI